MSAGSSSSQPTFECPTGTVHRKERVTVRVVTEPEFGQFEEYCQQRKVDGTVVKVGPYVRWGPNGEKQLEGQYLDGSKDGKWIRRFPSHTVEDTWRNGEVVEVKEVSTPYSYVIDFDACIPHEYNIPAAFGSTSYRLIGKRRGFCQLRYSIEIEMGQGPLVSCFVPTKNKRLVFINTQMGFDFTAIKAYCKK